MTTDDELRELIAKGEKAQPRPWTNVYNGAVTKSVCQQPPNSWGNELRLLLANCSMSGLYGTQNATYIVAAANLAPEIAAELIAAREEIQRLRVALESLRITSHTECEDCWYSCPKSDDYCGEDDREHCACGMDKQNAIVDAALNGGDL